MSDEREPCFVIDPRLSAAVSGTGPRWAATAAVMATASAEMAVL